MTAPRTTSRKKPQDRKPKAIKGSVRAGKFHYPTQNGTVTVPLLENLKFGVARRLRKLDESEAIYTLVEEAADPKSLAVIDEMSNTEVGAFIEAYYTASGVDLGESSASAS